MQGAPIRAAQCGKIFQSALNWENTTTKYREIALENCLWRHFCCLYQQFCSFWSLSTYCSVTGEDRNLDLNRPILLLQKLHLAVHQSPPDSCTGLQDTCGTETIPTVAGRDVVHTSGQVASPSLWGEVGLHEENPHRLRENLQTLYREAWSQMDNRTFFLCRQTYQPVTSKNISYKTTTPNELLP